MDVTNPVIKYCMAGSKAELEKNLSKSTDFYMNAWEISKDDYDFSIAAHYVARVQNNIQDIFKWNQIALKHAGLSTNPEVKDIYPSLYLNMGNSCEDLKDYKQALEYYNLGLKTVKELEKGSYGEMFKDKFQEKINSLPKNLF